MYGRILVSPARWGLIRRIIGIVLATSLCLGTVALPRVWAATYHVNDDTGDDGRTPAQAQNPATPWKTISHAVGEPSLVPGDVIAVAGGTYDQALGETFPLMMVDGVAITGAGPAVTTVRGPAASALFLNANTPLASGTTVSGLRLTHDAANAANVGMSFTLASAAMAPEISGNSFEGLAANDHGIKITDSGTGARAFTGTIESNSFSDLWKAVQAQFDFSGTPAELSPAIRGNSVTGSYRGVDFVVYDSFEGTASPVIADNQITGSTYGDLYLEYDIWNGHGATMTPLISGNTLSGGGSYGIALIIDSISLSSSSDVGTFSPTILNNTIVNTGSDGIEIDYDIYETYGELVSDLTIAGNTITNPGGTGIEISGSSISDTASLDVNLTIANNTITNSSSYGLDFEISASDYLYGNMDVTISGNTISGSAYDGIEFSWEVFSSSGTFGISVTLRGNTVTGSGFDGMDISVSDQTSLTTSRVDLVDNIVDSSIRRGMEIYVVDFDSPTSYVQVACNTVTNSTEDGLYLWMDGAAPPPDFGGGDLASPGRNTFMNNAGYDFYNRETVPVDAHSNWWGTTDGPTIDSHIWDNEEDPSVGAVEFSGWLSSAPTVSVSATLVDALEIDLSPPGPSESDTFRYTATLEGTGDCGCASALFTVPIPDNGVFVPGSLTASRGILINDDVSTLHPELIIGLGALAASETVTVTWDVVAVGGCGFTSQATLSCTQLGDVLTDDPDITGGSDPTTVTWCLFSDGFESGDTSMWTNTVP